MSDLCAPEKRFYDVVGVVGVGGGFGIMLDNRPVPTPLGHALTLPTEPLADAIAEEWRVQGVTVDPRSMPLSGLANTAIDRTVAQRSAIVEQTLAFAVTDLLCYRAEAPDDLVHRQHDCWQPLLDWAEESLSVRLTTTTGLLPVSQPPENSEVLKKQLENLQDMELTAVAALAAATSSLILAMAVTDGRIDSEEAFQAAQLDEIYQNERWGRDAETDARRRHLRADITAMANFITLARTFV